MTINTSHKSENSIESTTTFENMNLILKENIMPPYITEICSYFIFKQLVFRKFTWSQIIKKVLSSAEQKSYKTHLLQATSLVLMQRMYRKSRQQWKLHNWAILTTQSLVLFLFIT